jgi:apolipoprotein N-acyltransferase
VASDSAPRRPARLPVALLLAAMSGLLLSLASPPVQIEPIAFVALVPLLSAIRSVRPRRGLLLGMAFGFVYFATLLYWILLFGSLAWGVLSLASAAYAGAFGLLAPLVWRAKRPVRSALGLAALWTLTEYLRALWPVGGFTWGGLGYTQPDNGFLMPLASVTGVWGMSFVVALVNVLVLLSLERLGLFADARGEPSRAGRRPLRAVLFAGAAVAVVLAPALIPVPRADGPRVDVAILQGNDIEHRLPDLLAEERRIAENHAALERALRVDPPDLSVWPEDAVDVDPTRFPEFGTLVTGSVAAVGHPALVGAITDGPGGTEYNEGLLYDGSGRIVDRYRKVHLVPFGEYVPWRRALGWISALRQIPRDLTPGRTLHTIACPPGDTACGRLAGVTFGNVICYENAFPSLDRRLVADGARFLVVSTNNASYGRTAASRQHLIMSRLRAAENARWVVHAAISGISAFVDPEGRVHQPTGLFRLATDRLTIRESSARTLYTRLGDWFPWACGAAVLALILVPMRRARRPGPPSPLPPGARALVILPTYNERTTVGDVVARIVRAMAPGGEAEAGLPTVDVLVVDDDSPDGTGEVVERLAATDPRVRLLSRERKEGLAAAYLAGFRRALDEGYDVVVEMDADLSHQPEELPSILAASGRLDLVVGSRYVPGGSVTNWGLLRRLLSRGGNAYARAALGLPVRDATSGYRAFRSGLLRALLADGVHADGYGFQIELAYRAWRGGAAVGEVPITFRERVHGHSKISRRIVLEALWLVAVWGIRDRVTARPPTPLPLDRAPTPDPDRGGPDPD